MIDNIIYQLYNFKSLEIFMYWLASYIWNVGNYVDISGIAIGPVLGYVYQYKLIEKKQKIGTFSINLCGMLLFCNILRIGFYIFRNYA